MSTEFTIVPITPTEEDVRALAAARWFAREFDLTALAAWERARDCVLLEGDGTVYGTGSREQAENGLATALTQMGVGAGAAKTIAEMAEICIVPSAGRYLLAGEYVRANGILLDLRGESESEPVWGGTPPSASPGDPVSDTLWVAGTAALEMHRRGMGCDFAGLLPRIEPENQAAIMGVLIGNVRLLAHAVSLPLPDGAVCKNDRWLTSVLAWRHAMLREAMADREMEVFCGPAARFDSSVEGLWSGRQVSARSRSLVELATDGCLAAGLDMPFCTLLVRGEPEDTWCVVLSTAAGPFATSGVEVCLTTTGWADQVDCSLFGVRYAQSKGTRKHDQSMIKQTLRERGVLVVFYALNSTRLLDVTADSPDTARGGMLGEPVDAADVGRCLRYLRACLGEAGIALESRPPFAR